MNVQRTAAGIGAFLVLVLGTSLCVVTAGALAGLTGSASFGVVFKTFLVLALLASTLGAFMHWGQGGSMRLWLGIALGSYLVTPSSWASSTLFTNAFGPPAMVAWLADGVLWMALAWWTARRVLPKATRDEGVHRLR